jgi:hypothetical protein
MLSVTSRGLFQYYWTFYVGQNSSNYSKQKLLQPEYKTDKEINIGFKHVQRAEVLFQQIVNYSVKVIHCTMFSILPTLF